MENVSIPGVGRCPPCPVCGKDLWSHSEADLLTCSANSKGKDIPARPYGDWASADLQPQNKK